MGTFQVPTGIMVFQHTFSGVAFIAAVRAGDNGWILIDHRVVSATNNRILLNTVLALGREVFVAQAIYLLDGTLNITVNYTVLKCEGWGTVFTKSVDGDFMYITGLTGIVVADLAIDLNGKNSYGIVMTDCVSCTVRGIRIGNPYIGNYLIYLTTAATTGCSNCLIEDSELYTSSYSIFLEYGSYNTVRRNYIHGIEATRAGIYGENIEDCVVEGNHIVETTNSAFGIHVRYSHRTIIANNEVLSKNNGIDTDDEAGEIIGNIVKSTGGVGIYPGTVTHNRVADNHVYECYLWGIAITSDYSTIQGNTVYNCNVSNNANGHGIYLAASYCSVIGNIVQDDRTPKLHRYGIYEAGTENYNILVANVVKGYLTGAINISGAQTIKEHNQELV